MISSLKPKIRHADVLLRCANHEHGSCDMLRDSVMANCRNVTMAYITRTNMDTDYCVAASAFVKDGEINKFKGKLKALRSTGKRKFKVSKIKLFVSKQ